MPKISDHQFRLLVSAIVDYGVYMIDPRGIVMTWNAGAALMKGYSEQEIVGTHFSVFYTDEDRRQRLPAINLAKATETGRFSQQSWRVRKDGSRFMAQVTIDAVRSETGELLGFVKIVRDISEQVAAEAALEKTRAALLHAQKMEAIGQLSGGIAHDFNNLLTVIMSNLDLLGNPKVTQERRHRLIETCQRAADRAATLTNQLLSFGRRQILAPRLCDVNDLIDGMSAILRRACGELVTLRIVQSPRPPMTIIDASQFESAVLNVVMNAHEAMPSGGVATVTTEVRHIDAASAAKLDLGPGDYVVVSVTDTGIGMSEQTRERAFEPFFSTKPHGTGSGLGLSQVWGFATQAGGQTEIETAGGVGTKVRLYLPYAHSQNAGSLAVLLVEDEPMLRSVMSDLLESLRYRVIAVPDGDNALNVLRSDNQVDVLFTDVILPHGFTGIELAKIATTENPHLKVLLASGHPIAPKQREGFPFVGKPYRWSEIADKLRSLHG